jgi:hypothetical protein
MICERVDVLGSCREDPLTLSLSPRGEGTPELSSFLGGEAAASSLSPPACLGKLALPRVRKRMRMGEGWGEGVFVTPPGRFA